MKASPKSLRKISVKFARYAIAVGRSGIHHRGVYAVEDIPAHRRVVEYTGRRITREQAARLSDPKDVYLADVSLFAVIDGRVGGNGAEFINHSCEPNLKPRRSKGRLYFVSLRAIRAGEELTFRYAYPVKLRRIPCRCGARNCRKTFRISLG